MANDGKNWFLIVASVVMTGVVLVANVYILVHFQHPEDRNQAWVPKAVVVFGLSLAMLSVLMLPLDVGNRAACDDSIVLSACNFTMPMTELWYTVYMSTFCMISFIIPFTMFYYEADSEKGVLKRVVSAGQWVFVVTAVVTVTLGIAYAFGGYVDYESVALSSGLVPVGTDLSGASSCIADDGGFDGLLCDAVDGSPPTETFSVRTSFPVYVIASSSIISWILFMVYAGVGVVSLPADTIRSFVDRPRKTITRSQYIAAAKGIGEEAASLNEQAKQLQREQKSAGSSRKLRRATNKLNQELLALERKEKLLREAFPQGEEASASWAMTVMGYYLRLAFGLLATVLSVLWIAHVIVYMFLDPPESPFLNEAFIELDAVFSLFGTSFFALCCFYLILCVVKGNFKLGMSLVFVTIHPMEFENTLMSSFLFNVGIILLCSVSVIQFCAKAFDVYANETAVNEIFGDKLENLRGLGVLFKYNVFVYCFFGFSVLSLFYLLCVELRPKNVKRKREAEELFSPVQV